LGPYRKVKQIRQGHSCDVWEVINQNDQSRHAAKVLKEDRQNDRDEIASLKNEYEIGKNLKHPNIIKMVEFNYDNKIPYLVMELFVAPNLKIFLRQGIDKFAWMVPKIIEQAASSLDYLHREGYVHRDVKPDNFLVNETGTVKLIDFAISQKIKSGFGALFSFGSKLSQGTRSYMSPEQILNKNMDARSDVYSFGCVLFELVAGRTPYTGNTPEDLLTKHLTAPIPSVLVSNSNVTEEFANLIKRMMAKKQADRPPTMWEFLKEFKSMRTWKIVPKPPPGAKLPSAEQMSVSPDDLIRKPPQEPKEDKPPPPRKPPANQDKQSPAPPSKPSAENPQKDKDAGAGDAKDKPQGT
jgi:serine/threonine-protein kinase